MLKNVERNLESIWLGPYMDDKTDVNVHNL